MCRLLFDQHLGAIAQPRGYTKLSIPKPFSNSVIFQSLASTHTSRKKCESAEPHVLEARVAPLYGFLGCFTNLSIALAEVLFQDHILFPNSPSVSEPSLCLDSVGSNCWNQPSFSKEFYFEISKAFQNPNYYKYYFTVKAQMMFGF